MKKTYLYSVFFFLSLLLFFSCQRELSFENGQRAKGTLKNSSGNCLPANIGGTYFTSKTLGDTNFIEVTVDVTSPGNYTISTNTVNGFSFKGSGNFSSAGIISVKLKGTGKPDTVGNNHFVVQFDSSKCDIIVPSKNANAPATPAVFTLDGSPGNCMNLSVTGSFVKAIALTDSSKIKISVNVSVAGTYKINTDTINGFYFSGSGIVSTGVQSITLTAKGTPVNQGPTGFKVSAASTNCSFQITVTPSVSVSNPDHFPLTLNSYWIYDDLFNTGSTPKRTVTGQVNANGNFYKSVSDQGPTGTPEEHLYRKIDTNYYEYGSVDRYTTSVKFVPEIKDELLFLKEGLSTGSSWVQEFKGSILGGQVIYFRYVFTCTNANAVVTIKGQSFLEVYKINIKGQVKAEQANPYAYTGDNIDVYYAKGVGIIYDHPSNGAFTYREKQIKNWVVN